MNIRRSILCSVTNPVTKDPCPGFVEAEYKHNSEGGAELWYGICPLCGTPFGLTVFLKQGSGVYEKN
jgi:hypothetical protein